MEFSSSSLPCFYSSSLTSQKRLMLILSGFSLSWKQGLLCSSNLNWKGSPTQSHCDLQYQTFVPMPVPWVPETEAGTALFIQDGFLQSLPHRGTALGPGDCDDGWGLDPALKAVAEMGVWGTCKPGRGVVGRCGRIPDEDQRQASVPLAFGPGKAFWERQHLMRRILGAAPEKMILSGNGILILCSLKE